MTQPAGGVVIPTPKPRSVISDLAARYGVDPAQFHKMVRAQVFPRQGTDEQLMQFLMVCAQYDLNPLIREIYAMLGRGAAVVPVIGIDGWLSLINRHSQFDGMTLEDIHDDQGKLIACTCTIYRKDRAHPTVKTEYYSECWRDTEAWKMPHRMLSHKAVAQCARYAFGFTGIYEPDEAERIIGEPQPIPGPRRITAVPAQPPKPPPPPPKPEPPEPPPPAAKDPRPEIKAALAAFEAALGKAQSIEEADAAWLKHITPLERARTMTEDEIDDAQNLMRERCSYLSEAEDE